MREAREAAVVQRHAAPPTVHQAPMLEQAACLLAVSFANADNVHFLTLLITFLRKYLAGIRV